MLPLRSIAFTSRNHLVILQQQSNAVNADKMNSMPKQTVEQLSISGSCIGVCLILFCFTFPRLVSPVISKFTAMPQSALSVKQRVAHETPKNQRGNLMNECLHRLMYLVFM